MALIACSECGHTISSLARVCPKCSHVKKQGHHTPSPTNATTQLYDLPERFSPPRNVFPVDTTDHQELLQHEFKPSIDETIILQGRAYLIKSLFNVSDCYAYLSSKRYVLCDSSKRTILFQAAIDSITSVEAGRCLLSKKIIITTASGATIHIKSLPHLQWLNTLRDPTGFTVSRASNSEVIVSSESLDWYYESGGVHIGPAKERTLVQFIRNNHTILPDTNVWNATMPDWKRAADTILTIYFSETSLSGSEATPASGFRELCRKYL